MPPIITKEDYNSTTKRLDALEDKLDKIVIEIGGICDVMKTVQECIARIDTLGNKINDLLK